MLPLLRIETASGLLLPPLEQRFLPFTFRGRGPGIASHGTVSVYTMHPRSCYDASFGNIFRPAIQYGDPTT